MSPRPVLRHTLSPLRSVTVDPLARVTSPLRYRMGGEPGLFHILSATICREASNERHATDTRVGAAAPQAPPRMRSTDVTCSKWLPAPGYNQPGVSDDEYSSSIGAYPQAMEVRCHADVHRAPARAVVVEDCRARTDGVDVVG